jgi:hypothetical protein
MVIINDNQFVIIDNSNLEFESLPSVVLQGDIQSEGFENLYQLDIDKNITIILDVDFLAGDTMTDSVIYLLDADMNIIASNDNGNDDASSYIEFQINKTGTYYVRVEGLESNVGTYTLNISKGLFEITPSYTPTANDDTGTVVLGNTITIDVLSNDVGSTGSGILSVESASSINGAVVINIDNTIDYTPNVDFIGTDMVSYTILYSPQEQINHTLTFTNADIFGDYYNDIVTGIDAAMRQWEQYLSTYYPVNIEISITGLIQEEFLASASAEDVFDTNIHDPTTDEHIVISSIQYEIGRGIDLNGESIADGVIEISTNYLDEFWFDSTPYDLTDNIPNSNQIDFRSVMMHEIGHLLGFSGNLEYQPDAIYELYNYSPGSLSNYDTYIQWDANLNSFIFTGENAVSAYHDLGFVGNLPLYSEGYASGSDLYHYGLYLTYLDNPLNDYLMSHSATYGLIDSISLIDLGILSDLGYNSYSNTVIANVAVQVIAQSVDVIVHNTDNMLLDNLSLLYIKDSEDTGVSTLVEGGGISFDQVLDFDAVKLSDATAYNDTSSIQADDAVAILRDIVFLDIIETDTTTWHAADVNNDGRIAADDAVAILRHIVFLDEIDTFDLVDNTTGNRVTSLNPDAVLGEWTIVANGDVNSSGWFDDSYTVAVDIA